MNANKLKAIIVERGSTQLEMAEKLGITPKTFYSKMKSGGFCLDEANILIKELCIKNPAEIFFENNVT